MFLLTNIDSMISNKRKEYLTDTANQSLVYLEKYQDAINYKNAFIKDINDYPYVKEDMEEFGDENAMTSADRIIDARNNAIEKNVLTEKYRRRALLQFDSVETIDEAFIIIEELKTNLSTF